MINEVKRTEIEDLKKINLEFDQPWQINDYFEKIVSKFFGSQFAVSTDCSTHALELCLRLINQPQVELEIPKHTYMSVPMMLEKINQPWRFVDKKWKNYYRLEPFDVIDAAVLWERNSYVPGTMTCLSFQFKKHLPIGRGGMILLDDEEKYKKLLKMSHDGRQRGILQSQDNVQEIGYHYYMTPEDAARGIMLFYKVQSLPNRVWSSDDYFDLTTLEVFRKKTQA